MYKNSLNMPSSVIKKASNLSNFHERNSYPSFSYAKIFSGWCKLTFNKLKKIYSLLILFTGLQKENRGSEEELLESTGCISCQLSFTGELALDELRKFFLMDLLLCNWMEKKMSLAMRRYYFFFCKFLCSRDPENFTAMQFQKLENDELWWISQ